LRKKALSFRLSKDAKLNSLVAYPYVSSRIMDIVKEREKDVLWVVDSGAFTAWKTGKTISVDDYCNFLESLPVRPWRYFTLDVIGNPKESMNNYELMLSRGFSPIPIFTRGEDPSVIDDYYKTSDVVGIGGLVGTKNNKGFINGIMKHVGDRKVHWLGFTNPDYIKRYKPYMCDSSSWVMALSFASMRLYDKFGKFISCGKSDFIKTPSYDVLRLLVDYGVDPRELAKGDRWVNTGRGDSPTEKVAFRSFVKFQQDVSMNIGTNMFMAMASDWQLRLSLDALDYWRDKSE
jgi:hypothetical protein